MRLIDADALFQSYLDTDKQADLIKYEEDKLKAGGNGDFFPGFYTAVMIFRDLINEAPTIGGWISVKERLPEKDEEVIVCVQMENGMLYVTSAELWDDGLFWTDSGPLNSPRYKVTHWMQLPPPPEGGQDD